MKLKYSFETIDMGDELIAVAVGSGAEHVHGVLKLNQEAKEILTLLSEETTEENIVNNLAKRYENQKDTLAQFVHKVIVVLMDADLVES